LFLHPTKYTLDREELQAYLNGSIYDYADNEIVAEDNEKADIEYKQLAQTINSINAAVNYNQIGVEPHLL
jgi:hypothetical protein